VTPNGYPCGRGDCPAERVLAETIVLVSRTRARPESNISAARPEGHHVHGFGQGAVVTLPRIRHLIVTLSEGVLRNAGLYDAGLCERCVSGIAQYAAMTIAVDTAQKGAG
jgi:hypothetical protein